MLIFALFSLSSVLRSSAFFVNAAIAFVLKHIPIVVTRSLPPIFAPMLGGSYDLAKSQEVPNSLSVSLVPTNGPYLL